jgi:hypothetical protein
MSALAEYRTRILAILDDAALARYSNAQIDAALRWALLTYNVHRPLISTTSLDTDGNTIIELASDFDAIRILKVELFADDVDDVRELVFYAHKMDEAWVIQTCYETIPAGEVLIITYSAPNTVDDLDDAAGTTVPPEDEYHIQVGAAGYALRTRAASRIESNNLNDDTAQRLMQLAESNIASFLDALSPSPQAGFAALPSVPTNTF